MFKVTVRNFKTLQAANFAFSLWSSETVERSSSCESLFHIFYGLRVIVCLVAAKTKQNFSMFNYVPVSRVAVFLLALAIYGVQVKGELALESNEREKETSSLGETAAGAANDSWVESLAWNLLGYATIIVPAAVIIRMLKNSNFNERSGKMFFYCMHTCSLILILIIVMS